MKQQTLIVMSAILALAVAIPSIAAAKTSAPSGTPKDCEANYSDNAHGFNCWKSQVVPTNAAWRLRRAHTGTCY
jgi:Flp pilus assembly protein CpaB